MSTEERYDAIIIGTGPAGAACAYRLAKAGKEVLIIERGDTPGSKNVTGGRLYIYALEMLDAGLYEEAALERKVTHEQIVMLGGDRAINIDYHDPSLSTAGKPPISYTILRGRFDEWLTGKVEELGAMVACGIKVDGLLEKDGKIIGIRAGEDEMYSDVVVAADGVNSFIGQKAGLIKEIKAHSVGVGVKEVIALPPRIIEERFNLREGEGAARIILGCTDGIHGGGFLYTNYDSISLGCVFMPEEAAKKGKSIHQLFQDLKLHPSIYPLLESGETIEYGAHLVTESGYRGIPEKIYREGFLMIGEAAGFVINTGYSIRGMDLAIVSGIAAANAIIAGEDTSDVGTAYMKELRCLKLLPTMKSVDGFFDILETTWLYDKLPELANDLFSSLFTIKGEVPLSVKKDVLRLIKENELSLWQLIKLGLKGVKLL